MAACFTRTVLTRITWVWSRSARGGSIGRNRIQEETMLYKLVAYIHVAFARRARAVVAALESERAQGTVEYVGLILLVSLLMVGMVAAMKGFNGKQGTELADLIVNKIKQAVNAITFR
jgi:hypothetical protein